MAGLRFSLVSPARELFSGDVAHVIAPGSEGEFGVLPDHAPFMTTLKTGVVRVLREGQPDMRLFVRGGFADVTPEGLTILAEEAADLSQLDAASVDGEVSDLEARLAALPEGDDGRAALEDRIATLTAMRAALAS